MAGVMTNLHTFVAINGESEICCLCGGHKLALYHTHGDPGDPEKWAALAKLQQMIDDAETRADVEHAALVAREHNDTVLMDRVEEAERRLESIRMALKHAGHNACACDELTGFQCLLHGILDDGIQLKPAPTKKPLTHAKVSHRPEHSDPWRDEGGG